MTFLFWLISAFLDILCRQFAEIVHFPFQYTEEKNNLGTKFFDYNRDFDINKYLEFI